MYIEFIQQHRIRIKVKHALTIVTKNVMRCSLMVLSNLHILQFWKEFSFTVIRNFSHTQIFINYQFFFQTIPSYEDARRVFLENNDV